MCDESCICVGLFVLAGPERKARIPDEEANTITAYHEGGHAIVAHFTKDSHPLHKVTIIPRGPSLGHVSNSLIKGVVILLVVLLYHFQFSVSKEVTACQIW